MKMMIGALALTLWLGTTALQAQDKGEMLKEVTGYFENIHSGGFEEAFEFTHPRVFEMAPKEMLIASMEQMLNNPEMPISFDGFEVVFGKVLEQEGTHYGYVRYRQNLVIGLGAEGGEEAAQYMVSAFEAQPGTISASYDADRNSIVVLQESGMWGEYFEDLSAWRFLEDNEQAENYFSDVIPAEIKDDLRTES